MYLKVKKRRVSPNNLTNISKFVNDWKKMTQLGNVWFALFCLLHENRIYSLKGRVKVIASGGWKWQVELKAQHATAWLNGRLYANSSRLQRQQHRNCDGHQHSGELLQCGQVYIAQLFQRPAESVFGRRNRAPLKHIYTSGSDQYI